MQLLGKNAQFITVLSITRTFRAASVAVSSNCCSSGTSDNREGRQCRVTAFRYLTANSLNGSVPDWMLKKGENIDLSYNNFTIKGSTPNDCQEGNKVGWLLIAEVRSRLDLNNGGADPEKFVKVVQGLGFISVTKDFFNKMFVLFYFKKKEGQNRIKNVECSQLKPCLYNRR